MFKAQLSPNSNNVSPVLLRWGVPIIASVVVLCCSPATPLQAQSDTIAPPQTAGGDAGAGVIQVVPEQPPQVKEAPAAKKPKHFDGDKAWRHLQAVCNIGPRISTSPGMLQQQRYLEKHFKANGGEVLKQEFAALSPVNGARVALQNLMVRYNTDRKRRLLICCHYDTRPFPDRDKRNPRGVFIGANDGGSGVALLCELGRHLADMDGPWGVDLLFFDGEEFVIARQHPMFLGSTFFAKQYAAGKIPWKYEYGVLVDMVADKDLQIYFEKNSLKKGPDRLTRSIWGTAQRLGVTEFVPQARHVIRDDHLPLNEIARIPTCDIIDFDYPNPNAGNVIWHTTQDTIQNCSQDSLHKVGAVVLEWIREMQTIHSQPEREQ